MYFSTPELITLLCFAFTYLALAIGGVPGLRIDRAGIALVGATAMIVSGVMPLAEAAGAVEYRTLLLLFGMMIVVAFLRTAKFFERLARWALKRFQTPLGLLWMTILLSGLLSAFLVNDIVCLALTPLVLHLTRRLKLSPVPFLLGLATAANIGSTATITGNPQNMLIGTSSQISYLRFTAKLVPIAAVGLLVDFVLIAAVYRRDLFGQDTARRRPLAMRALEMEVRPARGPHFWLLLQSLSVTVVAVVLFFVGLPISLVALGAAAVLLLSRVRPDKIYRQIDWPLLVMFSGLFVVVRAFETRILSHWDVGSWSLLIDHPVTMLSVVSAGLSNLVSNVPAVLLFKPIMGAIAPAEQETAWLALAMSSTLAGNLTVLGSVANLIVAETARRDGVRISFWSFFRIGLPLTLITLTIGICWLQFAPY